MKISQFVLTFALIAVAGCSSDSAGTTSVPGRYHVDGQQFASMLADKFIEMGQAPETMRETLESKLSSSRFDLDLRSDGTFEATQVVLTDRRSYKGSWTKVGETFTLDQTHENGKALEDRMTGTWVGGKLDLSHEGEAGSMRVVLMREQMAAPSK